MRRYTKKEIDEYANYYFSIWLGDHSLHNAKRINKALGKLLKAETQRRKELDKQ